MRTRNLFMILAIAATPAFAQDKMATLDVNTSTVCEMCEKTIEGELIYEKGVKEVQVDLEKAVIHVKYDEHKTDPLKIRTAITKLGYAADDMPADETAWKKLPMCCKKDGCGKPAKPQ
jgi:copper chaperone CopZ